MSFFKSSISNVCGFWWSKCSAIFRWSVLSPFSNSYSLIAKCLSLSNSVLFNSSNFVLTWWLTNSNSCAIFPLWKHVKEQWLSWEQKKTNFSLRLKFLRILTVDSREYPLRQLSLTSCEILDHFLRLAPPPSNTCCTPYPPWKMHGNN